MTPKDSKVDNEKDDAAFITLITGTFRVCQATNASYQTTLANQLNRILDGTSYSIMIEGAKISLVDAYNNEELIKLFAVLDMFFNMFPKSKYATLRVGTIILSYKDCSALASAAHGASIMLKTTQDFAQWLLTPALRCDFYRLNIPCQEVSRPYSYMPYTMALRLAEKSPYSASANPTLHLFVHLIGSAYHIKRSVNALYVEAKGLKSVLSNVFLFVYAHEKTKDLDTQFHAQEDTPSVDKLRQYYKNVSDAELKEMEEMLGQSQDTVPQNERPKEPAPGDRAPPEIDQFEEDANADGDAYDREARFVSKEPSQKDALAWFHHLAHFKGAVPFFMRERTYEAWSKIHDPRPNTVGEYARNLGRGTCPPPNME